MAEDINISTTKLRDLVNYSPALNSLSEEERNVRINSIMASSPAQMQEIIKIFENEARLLKEIDDDIDGNMEEINNYITDTKTIAKDADRKERIVKENIVRKDEEAHAEDILKKLDEII